MDVKLLQPLNALSPMLVTLSGIVTEIKLLQFKNALSPYRRNEIAIGIFLGNHNVRVF